MNQETQPGSGTGPEVDSSSVRSAGERSAPLATLAVFTAGVLGRLSALGAWWNQDDWGQLARAAGVLDGQDRTAPARILSQQLFWSATWPLFHLDPTPYAVLRLILHGLSAVLVSRIGRRSGLGELAAALAGFLFAASPLAFTPLYWASGIQEILAVFFALLAVERWLSGGRRNLLLAVLAAAASIFSKESGLGLPLFFTILLWSGAGVRLRDKAFAWAMCLLLLLVAVTEGVLVVNHFSTAAGEPYSTGGLKVILANLGVLGCWLAWPGAVFPSRLGWGLASVGLAVFAVWAAWAVFAWRRGSKLPAAALAGALLSLGPALPLEGQLHPYLAYLAAGAITLTVGALLPRRLPARRPLLAVLLALTVAWGYGSMHLRLGRRDAAGLPADPVVRATSLSWQVCRGLPDLPLRRDDDVRPALTFLQIPMTARSAEMAQRLGNTWVTGSSLYHALGGVLGPRLVLGPEVRIGWTNSLRANPEHALVLCEAGTGFKHWGTTGNAALYAGLTDVALGHFERARKHFVRAAGLSDGPVGFAWDPDAMIVPFEQVLRQKAEFVDWTVSLLQDGKASGQEIGGLQDVFFQLLSACTGQTLDEVTAGSQQLLQNDSKRGE